MVTHFAFLCEALGETAPGSAPRTATSPPSHGAPAGVFFIIVATSVKTSDGLVGLRPGTRAIKQPDGRYLAQGHILELRPDQVTNDLRVARALQSAEEKAEREKAAQAEIEQKLQQEEAIKNTVMDRAAKETEAQAKAAAEAQAAAQRQEKIDAIKKELAAARQAKARLRLSAEIVAQDTKIRALQHQLSDLGVRGSMFY